jgi:hypothetical protein
MLMWLEGTVLGIFVTVAVKYYEVVSPNPEYCKSDINKWCCVEKFVGI